MGHLPAGGRPMAAPFYYIYPGFGRHKEEGLFACPTLPWAGSIRSASPKSEWQT